MNELFKKNFNNLNYVCISLRNSRSYSSNPSFRHKLYGHFSFRIDLFSQILIA